MTTTTSRRVHPAWWIALATFLTIIGAAGFRSTPGVLMEPLHEEFGWSHGVIGSAVSVNLVLFGLTAPFSAALMERFGVRRVVTGALLLVSIGSLLPVWMTASWQLVLCWGVLVGLGTGSMSMALVATITSRWFVARRGLVSGILTAAGATGQLIFLPVLARLAEAHGWRWAALLTAGVALLVVPLVLWRMHDHPGSLGVTAYGEPADAPVSPPPPPATGIAALALRTLRDAARQPIFWLLAGTFAICGASTNGLVGTHFIPAAHDHGMSEPTAASLLALIGIFDVAGTVFSGWLTDRVSAGALLAAYYGLRGLSLFLLPALFAVHVQPSMFVFVLFYGLDWVATVPPTMALCRQYFGERAPIVFGWVFASHQIGAAAAAVLAGSVRDRLGNYDLAWYVSGGLCLLAAGMCLLMVGGRARGTASSDELSSGAVAAEV
ncbi:MFS transporter [Luteipulveratus sp. YIM 133132]|uniref:MFS transporter n=1 Tax=Luteipulveratus flavus TaxID=3031728 RepID=UPI0023AEB1A6|nr:MFS transporter [Luteipulveratus sp. YIM 133132]MDE9367619.1 MFS transporter [Luteipulveratus sp. YIM 133132]